jgi:hypothetical protein
MADAVDVVRQFPARLVDELTLELPSVHVDRDQPHKRDVGFPPRDDLANPDGSGLTR